MECKHFGPITFSCAPSCWVCSKHGNCEKEKTAASAANTDNGKAERFSSIIPVAMIPAKAK